MNKGVLETLIQSGKVMVFSGTYCPYCTVTKNTLNKLGIPYQVRELDIDPIDSKTKKQLDTMCGFTSIPKIFIGTNCIGGNDALQELVESNEIFELLSDEGIKI
mmetsp:Transcript_28171/g.29364  ORF Transcript_28171/g.29364 Transcript_28171/m.29364 type:complete len:104 (+) Transcript_28171:28-339(+)